MLYSIYIYAMHISYCIYPSACFIEHHILKIIFYFFIQLQVLPFSFIQSLVDGHMSSFDFLLLKNERQSHYFSVSLVLICFKITKSIATRYICLPIQENTKRGVPIRLASNQPSTSNYRFTVNIGGSIKSKIQDILESKETRILN